LQTARILSNRQLDDQERAIALKMQRNFFGHEAGKEYRVVGQINFQVDVATAVLSRFLNDYVRQMWTVATTSFKPTHYRMSPCHKMWTNTCAF
jgi:hypothetical protein